MTDAENTPNADQPTPAGAQNAENNGQTPAAIPYERFKQINDERKALKDRLDALEAAENQRKEQERLAQGKHEEIINELKPKAALVDEYEALLRDMLEVELEEVPADKRKFVPPGDVRTQLAWLKDAKKGGLFARTPAPNTDAGAVGDSRKNVKLTPEQQKYARAANMTDEEYAKYMR